MWFGSFVNLFGVLLALKCVLSIPSLPLAAGNIEEADDIPYETQHAVCKVFTKEMEATANATINRQLNGVCSTRDLNLRFDILYQELQQIKQALLGLPERHRQYKSLDSSSTSHTITPTTSTSTTDFSLYEYLDYTESKNNIKDNKEGTDEKFVFSPANQLHSNAKLNEEILTFNDTIVENSDGDLYFYYWKIPEIKKALKRKDMYVSSFPFSVLGHTLHLQFYPNYMDEYTIGILLKPDSNSFLKKHKILFLGQRSTQNQISSRILYGIKNEEKIFKIEPEMLNDNFISTDSLLVKIKIYLNS